MFVRTVQFWRSAKLAFRAVDRQLGSYQLINRAAHRRGWCFLRCRFAFFGSVTALWLASLTPPKTHISPRKAMRQVPQSLCILLFRAPRRNKSSNVGISEVFCWVTRT